ncbi:ATP-binding protein [Streptomyces sp. H27-C3]|uniref:sensor histidine kinase n=1 Tax=Streptomyces sp. H27-C3 TaxID=3046305 RepID=UPI0024B8B7F4|nr:ATP-binding protein [Streptomyces sp. H27-C3]MDJ0465693.1 ATP-binding protein [Streptomyces sp. H27-C3]
MSQLRAPAARADRREGGRHGRPGSRPNPAQSTPEVHIRPQLLRAAVLPAIVVALSGAAAVVFTLRSTATEPTRNLGVALAAAAALAVVSLAAAVVGADRAAKSVLDRCNALRGASARGQADLRAVVEQLRRGEGPPARRKPPTGSQGGDEFDLLALELGRAHESAVGAVVQAAQLSSSAGTDQKVEVFVNLARRLQSLVHREIQLLDELENEVEDPELLKGLFHVDHLATRIRRHAENLAVLGGAISRRQWSNPVTMTEVLRSSIAEVEQYSRVKLVPPVDGTLRGHAVADVIHLLAELVENATVFSAPHTTVLLRAQRVTSGLAIEVEDRGLGMSLTEQNKMNALLCDPDQVNVGHLLQDGRIGLFVVSALARRHGINVRLQANIYGGVQAVLVLPQALLGTGDEGSLGKPETAAHRQPLPAPAAAPTPAPTPPVPTPATGSAPPLPVRGAQGDRSTPAAARPGTGPSSQNGQNGRHAHTGQAVQNGFTGQDGFTDQNGVGLTGDRNGYTDGLGPTDRNGYTDGNGHADLDGYTGRNNSHPDMADLDARSDPPAEPPAHSLTQPRANGYVRGSTSRPLLPRRRSQEHLAPQLREAPAVREDEEHPAIHDPGLMAAFQRGIGLAEAQPDPYLEAPDPYLEAPAPPQAPGASQLLPPFEPFPQRFPSTPTPSRQEGDAG